MEIDSNANGFQFQIDSFGLKLARVRVWFRNPCEWGPGFKKPGLGLQTVVKPLRRGREVVRGQGMGLLAKFWVGGCFQYEWGMNADYDEGGEGGSWGGGRWRYFSFFMKWL